MFEGAAQGAHFSLQSGNAVVLCLELGGLVAVLQQPSYGSADGALQDWTHLIAADGGHDNLKGRILAVTSGADLHG